MSRDLVNEYAPDEVSIPGETLQELLDDRGLTQADLAERTGRPKKTINEIVKGKAAITPETALQLERVLGVPAAFWNNLERNYREHLARREEELLLRQTAGWLNKIPVSAMAKAGWIRKQSSDMERIREVLGFFGIASPEQWRTVFELPQASFRISAACASEPGALAAWLRKGEIDALEIDCQTFDEACFRARLKEVRELTTLPPEAFMPRLRELCATCGVTVVFVPHLPKCPTHGAARWLSPSKALVQLSLRYKTDDHLWFTFFHEAAHLLLHGKRQVFVDGESLTGADWEQEANAFASEFLVPTRELEKLRFWGERHRVSRALVLSSARELGIAPGILVGRLQHIGWIPRTHLNNLKRKLAWEILGAMATG